MQGLRRYPNDAVQLDLGPLAAGGGSSRSPSPSPSPSPPTAATLLSIDDEETAEARIQRLIEEHPVIIFSRTSCCMCHAMKNLLATIGVHPTVIELDDHEIPFLPSPAESSSSSSSSLRRPSAPSVFIGGACIGGLESVVALHLSGHLTAKLTEVGALALG